MPPTSIASLRHTRPPRTQDGHVSAMKAADAWMDSPLAIPYTPRSSSKCISPTSTLTSSELAAAWLGEMRGK
eukprot:353088-Chlamydomonas_euryale.AAC.12